MLNIIIFDRMGADQFPGGDTVQINAIADYLRNKGHDVRISSNPLMDITDCDLVIMFNLTNPIEAYLQAKAAWQAGKPYIVFPVYWNLDTLQIPNWSLSHTIKNALPQPIKWIIRTCRFWRKHYSLCKAANTSIVELMNHRKMIALILKHAKYVCPNSMSEKEHLLNHCSVEGLSEKCRIIYNGFDQEEIFSIIRNHDRPDLSRQSYICCMGGIGPRKNQLNLVKAVQGLPIDLYIVGKVSPGNEHYLALLKKHAASNVHFFEPVEHREALMMMYRSRGLIQPSYIETPGLAALEASALGVPIIVSDVPPVREYFQEAAFYCKPDDVDSIRDAILRMLTASQDDAGERYFDMKNFHWERVLANMEPLLATQRF